VKRINLRTFEPVEPLEPGTDSQGNEYASWGDVKHSQTFLRTHNDCPRAGYLYLKYHGGAAGHNMDVGSALHRFAERATNTLIEEGEPRMPYDVGKDLMEHVIETSTDLVLPIGLHDDLRWMAFHWCEGMFIPPEHVAGVEVMLELDVPLATGEIRTIRGKADLVLIEGTTCTIFDYKTMFIPGAQDYAKHELSGSAAAFAKAYQTRFYAVCAAFGRHEGHPYPLAEHCTEFLCGELYPRHLWDEGIGQIGPVVFTRPELNEELASITGQVRQVEERLETWDWPARHGNHCRECPAAGECPIPAVLRDVDLGEPETEEDIAAYATRHFFDERRVGEDRKVLKGWYNLHGPIRFGKDLIWESHDQTTEKMRNKQEFRLAVERAVKFGEPFELSDHYRVSTSKRFLRRALTPHELLAEEEGADLTVNGEPPPDWAPLEPAKKAELDRKYGVEAPF
jgi:PD-(D/E)XK nuclease superfamily protein